MQVVFLGGANGIGASCVAVQIGDRWLLVDAGVRMDPRADRLPDLAFLQDKSIAAIFVTHAHADHIGALPLVQQAFPAVPIYASRATMLLMEVMLEDALQVMAKRANDALEVPLYDEPQVAATVQMLRPLPLTGEVTVPELPGVTVYTARSGHVAGAISLGFEAPDGRLVISGDVSVTPQRTVPGAALIGLRHPDLLVLESTYGSRLHPNRQTEEERLAQAVAGGIERGGHVLIPAFALGRAQEVLRILSDAQRRGRIPEFPIWVDGLVRAVCATYTAIPEALTSPLERQIRKGYSPFFGGMVRAVTEPRKREQLLQGSPACIVSSSGMLTGGPSAFYATHLAEGENNSILITGYQDEEAPGRRLLALAEAGSGTLDIGGQSVAVRCHFDRYNLSAHADGGELAGMVGALKPKAVALVHGDNDARAELAQRLERLAEVRLPPDGQQMEIAARAQKAGQRGDKPRRKRSGTAGRGVAATPALSGTGVGEQQPLDVAGLPRLWLAVNDNSGEQVVSSRELALAWYGTAADSDADAAVQAVLVEDQRFFVPHPDLPGMVRVRAPAEVDTGALQPDQAGRELQPGVMLLLSVYGEKLQPALCLDVRPETIRAYIPDMQRSHFPRPSVLEVLGIWPDYPLTDVEATRRALANLAKAAQQWQRQHPLRSLVEVLEPEQDYRLDEVCALLHVAPDDLAARLGVALLLNGTPDVIQREVALVSHRPSYRLQQGETAARIIEESDPRPDQMAILSILERHLGTPPDLYRRSINPETGAVTLSFHFPDSARREYWAAIDAAASEAGVPITIAPQRHQGALTEAAHAALPPEVTVHKTSLHHPRQTIVLRYSGAVSAATLQEAQDSFHTRTGWTLELEPTMGAGQNGAGNLSIPATLPGEQPALDMHQATTLVKATLGPESGCYKVSADQARRVLQVRFHFPDMARQRYAEQLAELSQQTGWQVAIYPHPHQGELDALVRRVLPSDLHIIGAPSLYRDEQQVVVRCRGAASDEAINEASEVFSKTTGWCLIIKTE